MNSVVLIKDDKKPRLVWALGKVLKQFKGIDGRVRALQLKTEKGVIVRSINCICPLEGTGVNETTPDIQNQLVDPTMNRKLNVESEDKVSEKVSSEPISSTIREKNPVRTRSGREIKPKQVIDL